MNIVFGGGELGLLLIIVGIILIIIAFFKIGRGGRGGGILLIGPIPIIWGSDRESLGWVVLIGLILFIIYIIFIYLVWSGWLVHVGQGSGL